MQNGPLTLTSLLVATVAFLMTLLPMIPFVQHFPLMAPFSMFANDTFYYLDVARNSQGVPFYTFDGTHATNGFHPVWQFLLYFCVKHRWIDLAEPAHGLVQLFYFNLAILSAAVFGLALAASRYLQHKWLALLTVCPGWLWFLMAVSAPGYLANWSYLNGMETAVELFFLACVLLSYRPAAHPLRWLPVASFFLGMMVLSRLDDVFFLLPVLGWIVLRTPRSSRRIAVLLSSIPFVMIAAYLLYNVLTVGRAMPISGAVKAGLALHENLRLLLSMFAPVDWNDAHNKASVGFSMFAESYMRIFQMTFPMLVSALYLARWRAAGRGLLDWLCVGVLLKGGYNFFFVSLFSQGHWYYGVSVFVANLVLSIGIDYALVASAGAAGLPKLLPRPWRYAAIAGEILLVLFSMNAFVDFKLNAQPGMQMQLVLERRAQVAQMVRSAGGGARDLSSSTTASSDLQPTWGVSRASGWSRMRRRGLRASMVTSSIWPWRVATSWCCRGAAMRISWRGSAGRRSRRQTCSWTGSTARSFGSTRCSRLRRMGLRMCGCTGWCAGSTEQA